MGPNIPLLSTPNALNITELTPDGISKLPTYIGELVVGTVPSIVKNMVAGILEVIDIVSGIPEIISSSDPVNVRVTTAIIVLKKNNIIALLLKIFHYF
jgi:hypothetical protein